MKNKVWLVQQKQMDYRDANQYGEIRAIYQDDNSFNLFGAYSKALELFNQDADKEDWIILCGYQTLNAAAAIAFFETFGVLNTLIFDSKTGTYVPRNIKR